MRPSLELSIIRIGKWLIISVSGCSMEYQAKVLGA